MLSFDCDLFTFDQAHVWGELRFGLTWILNTPFWGVYDHTGRRTRVRNSSRNRRPLTSKLCSARNCHRQRQFILGETLTNLHHCFSSVQVRLGAGRVFQLVSCLRQNSSTVLMGGNRQVFFRACACLGSAFTRKRLVSSYRKPRGAFPAEHGYRRVLMRP